MPKRLDDFSAATKRMLAARAGYVCSCPTCLAPTIGPGLSTDKSVSVGVAAHITAAQPKGPRYDSSMSPGERRSLENGIWLCANHATQIDMDPARYPTETLKEWKRDAEFRAHKRLGKSDTCSIGNLVAVSPPVRLGAETSVVIEGKQIAHAAIFDVNHDEARPTWFIDGYVLQFSIQKKANLAHVVFDHFVVTVHDAQPIPSYHCALGVFPTEVSLYYVEIDLDVFPCKFSPTKFFKAKEDGLFEEGYPMPRVVDDNLPAHFSLRINAKRSSLYLLSIDVVSTSGENIDHLEVLPPQWVAFENYEDSDRPDE